VIAMKPLRAKAVAKAAIKGCEPAKPCATTTTGAGLVPRDDRWWRAWSRWRSARSPDRPACGGAWQAEPDRSCRREGERGKGVGAGGRLTDPASEQVRRRLKGSI
jgi:hypothetical protein